MRGPQAAGDVTLAEVNAAQQRLGTLVRRTPLLQSERLDALSGAQLQFKCENLQYGGAFKARGALNTLLIRQREVRGVGVVTHSSGNHGAAVARAARLRGVPAHIVMPEGSATVKLEAVRREGAELHLCAPTLAARETRAAEIAAATGALFVHPYDDPAVIAGQGTVALELLEQLPQLDCVLCPIGGGGLASGIGVVIKTLRPDVRVFGVEPAGADDAARGLRAGQRVQSMAPGTIADGLRALLSERTFALLQRCVDDVVTVSEAGIVQAMRTLWSELRVIVEPSAAVPYAALAEGRLSLPGRTVAVILTGGNVDLDKLPWRARQSGSG